MSDESEYQGWSNRVAVGGAAGSGFAYRPRQVIARGPGTLEFLVARFGEGNVIEVGPGEDGPDISELEDKVAARSDGDGSWLITLPPDVDALRFAADLRDEGLRAEPNYVLFAHTARANPFYANEMDANPFYANPFYANTANANPFYANPFYANPFYANPFYANPFYANPFYANPFYANNYQRTGLRPSSARPAQAPALSAAVTAAGQSGQAAAPPAIIVLDTGLAVLDRGQALDQRPPLLERLGQTPAYDEESPDEDGDPDGALDPAAGHGTFIAGIIEQLVPGRQLAIGEVLTTLGDGDEWDIGARLDVIKANGIAGVGFGPDTILNLSFGGYAPEEASYLAKKIRKVQDLGAVVVASAGNDSTSAPLYPACLPGVVSVGALGPFGPAPFTNFGPWVRACAPGTDIVSSFFTNFDGPLPGSGSYDGDNFRGWARWSGSSFAAPIVAAALAREMLRSGCSAEEAVAAIIDAPGLFRIPGLGTVVNLA
ncbi:MAG: S8 family serine peptidase [Dehalococcoidia bacterium]